MFTPPPRPPKDYALEEVSLSQASAPVHTPLGLPRATQPSIGKYCVPIKADDNEPADKSQIEELNKDILEILMKKDKAHWVERPGKNAFFLHDICKTYSVEVEPERDVRFHHKPSLFPRSFKCELDCLEARRLQKLCQKMEQEEKEEQDLFARLKGKPPDAEVARSPCIKIPPFWWKQQVDEKKAMNLTQATIKMGQSVDETSYLRWQPLPKITDEGDNDPCRRREAFAQ
ncbi:hypothetical protein FQR65_LT08756 [Abscondita terminalis]|nr:hypothetical protein FQR65_LT08756 [Abscondita terminalis]